MKSDRHIILTGCNGQVGSAISRIAKKNGIKIHGIDIQIQEGYEMDSYTQGDVSAKETAINFFNNLAIDGEEVCLINNAGIAVFSDSEERTYEEFAKVMMVNCFSVVSFITQINKWNRKKDGSNRISVVNIGSIYGCMSPDFEIYSDTSRVSSEVYGASKAGVIQMTKYFAVKYAKVGCRVNSISPGGIINEDLQGPKFIENYCKRVPSGEMCTDEEIAEVVLDVGFSKAKNFTGQNILVDGGLSSW